MFTEDLTPFFDTSAGFAQAITLGGVDVGAIFDNAFALGQVGPFGMATTQPTLTLPSSAVPADPVGLACTVAGVGYTVAAHEPDGTGVSRLVLELAA